MPSGNGRPDGSGIVILGAVLAGGLSTRFGTDKALACLDGVTLLDRAIASLAAQCDDVVVVGREVPGMTCVADWPAPHMGPLAGVAGALRHGATHGYAAVLTTSVDAIGLGPDLAEQLSPAPAFLASQPVIGLWPTSAAADAEAILTSSGRHAMRALADRLDARAITLVTPPANINTPADLAALAPSETRHGL